jgi:acetolactate synthase-1/2/3 large subunit
MNEEARGTLTELTEPETPEPDVALSPDPDAVAEPVIDQDVVAHEIAGEIDGELDLPPIQDPPIQDPPVEPPIEPPVEPPAEPPLEAPGEPGPAPVIEPPAEPSPAPIIEPPAEPGGTPDIEAPEMVLAATASGEDAEARTQLARPRTVAEAVASALRAAGVRWAYGVPGESFLPLLDALTGAGIHVVATRHEGAAAFMADAHGQLTGRPAICMGTRAVGASNLAIGIHTARANSSPMFALVGQVESAARGREAFQEVDLVGTIGGLAKFAAEPTDAAGALEAIGEAVREALGGRPGPALLALREDLLEADLPDGAAAASQRIVAQRPDDADVRAVLHLLAAAERPVILAGAGVLRARTSNDLIRLAELLRVPVMASWRRGDVISNDHPLYLGMTGYYSPPTVRERLENADALLVIGCRLNEITSFGWAVPGRNTRWAHVDVEPGRPDAALRAPDLTVTSDARLFVKAAVARLEGNGVLEKEIADRRTAANEAERAAFEAATVVDETPWSGPGVHPGRVITTLRRVLPDDAIVTTDAGNFSGWLSRGFRFRRPGTFLGPTSGAMGAGLPAAIAAALVHRDRAVVALVGDGGLGMALAELETAVREHAKVVVLAFDNERYGTIRMYQDREGHGAVATDLGPVDFAAVARAMGARGVRVEDDAAFEPALRQALASDRTTLLHLALDRRWVDANSRPGEDVPA